MSNKTYLIFPKILKGKEAEEWEKSHRQVIKYHRRGEKIDGIDILPKYFFNLTGMAMNNFYKALIKI